MQPPTHGGPEVEQVVYPTHQYYPPFPFGPPSSRHGGPVQNYVLFPPEYYKAGSPNNLIGQGQEEEAVGEDSSDKAG